MEFLDRSVYKGAMKIRCNVGSPFVLDEVDTTATCLHWSIQQYCRNGGTTEGFGTYHSNIYPGKM